eukprot:jgi/Mesvir1/3439/Mv11935-RA.1
MQPSAGATPPPLPEVVQVGDPVLRTPAREVPAAEIGTQALNALIETMVAVMRSCPGVGLAAPQIGVPLRVIVLEDQAPYMASMTPSEIAQHERAPFDLTVLINPVLQPVAGTGRIYFFEGCLSVTGFRALVPRHLEVQVDAVDREGRPVSLRARGWKARILQHEMDHLEGTLYVDRMVTRSFRTGTHLKCPLPDGCPAPGTYLEN